MARRALRLFAWIAIGLMALLALARMFLFGIYHVDSPSMEPTVHGAPTGGDHLMVVDGGISGLQRFDLVVLLPAGESEPRVKRAHALPGEAVAIRDGILWIDGAPLPEEAPRPAPIPIFDDALLDLEYWFRLPEGWKRDPEGWALDAREVAAGANSGLILMKLGLDDHYFDPDGELVLGQVAVDDGILECEVRQGDPPARLRLGLTERGDTFEAVIEPGEGDEAALRLIRRNPELNEVVAEGSAPFAPGFHSLRFANVDNRVRFEIDGRQWLAYDYETNAFRPSDTGKTGDSAPFDRVYLGGEQGRATFRRIRVLRDLDYTMPPDALYAVGKELQLGPAEIFVLGDNSANSTDGRHWGPTKAKEVIGAPLAVVWPPSRLRWLRRPAED